MLNQVKSGLFLIPCLIVMESHAINWQFEPTVSVSETYSDNINLADDGLEDDDFVTSVSPGITITTDTKYHTSTTNYVLQKIKYLNIDKTETFNSLNSDGELELIQDHFFTEYTVRNGQQNVSNIGALATDNLSRNNNRQNVLSYDVYPKWKQRFGVYAFLEAGFRFNEIISENNNSTSETVTIRLDHGTLFNRILWDLEFSDETIENDFGNQTIFRNIAGNVRYLVTRKFALTSQLGYDDNEFQSSDNISGLFWNAGVEWNPSRRTSFSAAVGERFFGTDYKLNISYLMKRARLQLKFDQTPETTRNNLLRQQVFNLEDIFGEVIIDPETGLPADIDVLVPQQTNEVLINKKFSLLATYDYKKTYISMEFYANQREFQLTGDTEDTYGTRAEWRWRLSPTLNTNTRFEFYSQDTRQGSTSDQVRLNFRVSKNLTRDIYINGGFGHSIRDVDAGGGSYKETRAFVGLTKDF